MVDFVRLFWTEKWTLWVTSLRECSWKWNEQILVFGRLLSALKFTNLGSLQRRKTRDGNDKEFEFFISGIDVKIRRAGKYCITVSSV